MSANIYIRYDSRDIKVLEIGATQTCHSGDDPIFFTVAFLLEFGCAVTAVSSGDVYQLDGTKEVKLLPDDEWTVGSRKRPSSYVFIPIPGSGEDIEWPYWKDLYPYVISSTKKRAEFHHRKASVVALARRTFQSCSLTGSNESCESCHIVGAKRSKIFEKFIIPRCTERNTVLDFLKDARNGIVLCHKYHVCLEEGSLMMIPCNAATSKLRAGLYDLRNNPPAPRFFFWDEELDGDVRLPPLWLWRYKFATSMVAQFGTAEFRSLVRQEQVAQQEIMQWDEKGDDDGASLGSANTAVGRAIANDQDGASSGEDSEKGAKEPAGTSLGETGGGRMGYNFAMMNAWRGQIVS